MSAKTTPAAGVTEAAALAYFAASASLSQANGFLLIETGYVSDQAHMRAEQLTSLLQLMRAEDGAALRSLGNARQDALVWMAGQLADEVQAMLPMVIEEAKREAA